MKKSTCLLVLGLLCTAMLPAQLIKTSSQEKTDSLAPKVSSLQEVVVTALGINRQKKALGYSTQNIDGRVLNQGSNPNLATALQGKVAGLEVRPSSGMPGASAQVIIRGSRFFDGNNAPLYIIDGLPISSEADYSVSDFGTSGTDYSGRSIDLNPGDIESINILKGQAAAALYGMRASNGAIIITTKKGKKSKKPIVAFTTNWQIDNISRLPNLQTTYAQGLNGAAGHFGKFVWGPEISTLADDPTYGGNVPNEYNNFTPDPTTADKYWSPQRQTWVEPKAHNNVRDFFQTGLTATNNLSISQGFDRGNYYLGFSSTNQKGIIPSSAMDRYNVKFSGDYAINTKIKTGLNGFYSNTSIDKIPTGSNSLLFEIYGVPANYDLKGTPISEDGEPYKQISYRDGFENPYWATQHNSFNEKTRRLLGSAYISYMPIPSVNIRYQAGVDRYTTDFDEYYELGSASTSGSTASEDVPSLLSPGGGSLLYRTFDNTTINSLLTITYKAKINNNWGFNFLAGNEVNDTKQNDTTTRGLDFTEGGVHDMSNASTPVSVDRLKGWSRTVGFFANAQFDWRNMVFLTLTGRNDIVSSMPPGHRSFFYPSASVSWIFSELDGLRGKDFTGKLRASYAEVGLPGIYKERFYIRHSSSTGTLTDGIQFPFAGVTGYRPNTVLYDPNMKPQNTASIELGTELRFLNGRVGVDYTYSKQNTTDQIFSVPLAGSTGYSSVVTNGGEMSSKVHEVTLLLTPVSAKNFEWNVTANFTKEINKVVSLPHGIESVFLGGFTDPQVRAAIGYTYPSIYGSSYLRNAEGQLIIDDDSNSPSYGMPLYGGEAVIGSVTPKFILGINNSFRYKFIRLSALIDWKNGGQMFSGANKLIDWYGTSAKTANRATDQLIVKGVKASTVQVDNKGGDVNDIVISGSDGFQAYYDYLDGALPISEASVYNSSFVKLREVALSFDIPSTILKRSRVISSASFTISARNILLWTAMPNFDPESSQGNGNMAGGFDYMSLPQTRSIGVGLNLTF